MPKRQLFLHQAPLPKTRNESQRYDWKSVDAREIWVGLMRGVPKGLARSSKGPYQEWGRQRHPSGRIAGRRRWKCRPQVRGTYFCDSLATTAPSLCQSQLLHLHLCRSRKGRHLAWAGRTGPACSRRRCWSAGNCTWGRPRIRNQIEKPIFCEIHNLKLRCFQVVCLFLNSIFCSFFA